MSDIIFGTDGWRGSIAEDYTFDSVRRCSQGFADYIKATYPTEVGRGVVVGGDKRFLSEHFAAAAAEVLAANDVPVHFTGGGVPTPTISFGVTHAKALGAVNITASHNPPTDNGFKVRDPNGGAIDPAGLKAIEAQIPVSMTGVKRMRFDDAEKAGLIKRYDPVPAYDQRIRSLVDVDRIKGAGLSVLVDNMWGNGAGVHFSFHRWRQDEGGRVPCRPQPAFSRDEAARADPAKRRRGVGKGA